MFPFKPFFLDWVRKHSDLTGCGDKHRLHSDPGWYAGRCASNLSWLSLAVVTLFWRDRASGYVNEKFVWGYKVRENEGAKQTLAGVKSVWFMQKPKQHSVQQYPGLMLLRKPKRAKARPNGWYLCRSQTGKCYKWCQLLGACILIQELGSTEILQVDPMLQGCTGWEQNMAWEYLTRK